MVYEEEIISFEELLRELSILDMDAGLRIETQYQGHDSYIFITRSVVGYALRFITHYKKETSRYPRICYSSSSSRIL